MMEGVAIEDGPAHIRRVGQLHVCARHCVVYHVTLHPAGINPLNSTYTRTCGQARTVILERFIAAIIKQGQCVLGSKFKWMR